MASGDVHRPVRRSVHAVAVPAVAAPSCREHSPPVLASPACMSGLGSLVWPSGMPAAAAGRLHGLPPVAHAVVRAGRFGTVCATFLSLLSVGDTFYAVQASRTRPLQRLAATFGSSARRAACRAACCPPPPPCFAAAPAAARAASSCLSTSGLCLSSSHPKCARHSHSLARVSGRLCSRAGGGGGLSRPPSGNQALAGTPWLCRHPCRLASLAWMDRRSYGR